VQDTELYRHLLDLELPWTLSKVNLHLAAQRVDVYAEHSRGEKWPCPVFGEFLPVYDHSEERVWRPLDSCRILTFHHANPPCVNCWQHGYRRRSGQEQLRFLDEKAIARGQNYFTLVCDIDRGTVTPYETPT
jgi:hypothetical protein